MNYYVSFHFQFLQTFATLSSVDNIGKTLFLRYAKTKIFIFQRFLLNNNTTDSCTVMKKNDDAHIQRVVPSLCMRA